MVSKTKSKTKKKGKLAKASKKSSTKKRSTKKKTRVTAVHAKKVSRRPKKVSRRPKKTTAATSRTLSKEIETSSTAENIPSSLGETTIAYETQSLAPDTLQDEATTISTAGVQDEEYNPEDTSIS